MKVVLARPDHHSHLIQPPLALGYLAAYLRREGHQVKAIDGVNEGLDNERLVERCADADLVGFSILSDYYPQCVDAIKRLKARGVKVVVGGPHVTVIPTQTLEETGADFAVTSEGEPSVAALAADLDGGGDGECLPGVVTLNHPHPEVRPLIKDLGDLPFPDWDDMPPATYPPAPHGGVAKNYPIVPVTSSRGCPYNCSFCISTRMTGRRWRPRSVENIVGELELLRDRYGFQAVFFVDDNMSANLKRLEKLCRTIIERRVGMRWWAMSRADTIVENEPLVGLMARAGCGTIFMGLESASDKVLEKYDKKSTVDTSAGAVKILHKHGIRSQASFILGSPDETARDMRKTIEFAKRLNPKVGQFSLLTPFPGAALWDELADRVVTKDWSLFDCTHAVYRSDSARIATRERMWKTAYREFYIRLRYVLAHWKTINFRKTFSLLAKMGDGEKV